MHTTKIKGTPFGSHFQQNQTYTNVRFKPGLHSHALIWCLWCIDKGKKHDFYKCRFMFICCNELMLLNKLQLLRYELEIQRLVKIEQHHT